MTSIRSALFAATLLSFSVATASVVPTRASAASAQAQFCILRGGGGEGGSGRTDSCIFSDYQQCLQAAASGGNCVQNIDYHGGASTATSPRVRRRAR
ncbi:hypothetical protein BH11PSE4_BH11PSE4_25390 [soil metagenome]